MNTYTHLKTAILFFILVFSFTFTQAQTNSNNMIEEVQLKKTDQFDLLKDAIANNFDFSEVDSPEGKYLSDVNFKINNEGEIINVKAKGECSNVNSQLEKTIKELIFKIKIEELGTNAKSFTYNIPVELILEK